MRTNIQNWMNGFNSKKPSLELDARLLAMFCKLDLSGDPYRNRYKENFKIAQTTHRQAIKKNAFRSQYYEDLCTENGPLFAAFANLTEGGSTQDKIVTRELVFYFVMFEPITDKYNFPAHKDGRIFHWNQERMLETSAKIIDKAKTKFQILDRI